MPVYEYKALNKRGRKVGGIITADGPAGARFKLSQGSVFPTELKEVREKKKIASESLSFRIPAFSRVNPLEATTALRQLATLVSAGLPLLDCLTGLVDQIEGSHLKRIFIQIREKVVEGNSLSQAVSTHPGVFSPIHVNMIRAGETGGALDVILKRLADFSEGRMKLRKKIETALAYPLFLLLISTVIVIFLMSFVMPKVISVFEGMKLALPWSTRALILMTHFMEQFWWLVALAMVGVVGALYAWVKTEAGGLLWDRMRLRIPLFGKLHHKAAIARFSRTLSILLKSGIPLVDSLEIARLSMGNRIMEDAVKETARLVGEGQDFATPIKKTGRFPPLVVQLIRAGEQSGELEDMLAKSAEVYEEDVEMSLATLTALIEPAIILTMGVVVGFMVMAILLPIFDMTGAVR
ncbi:MAG: type II secretion system F family protein [Deltaproteobacteria bacterium]|nr:type II secretion system F family protein [Deltaproteobacteria bacterium]